MKTINASITALKVINSINSALEKSPTGVSLVSIKGYTNRFNEVSNNLVNVGASYANAKNKDVETLKELDILNLETQTDKITLEKARTELINSFIKPNENRSKGQTEAYTIVANGIKVHNETGEIYIFGLRMNKKVVQQGEYPLVNSRALTLAKNELKKQLKSSKFTQFKLSATTNIKTNGEELIFE